VAAKAGVAAITQALADELAGDGILVNAVLPSIIDTPANRAAMPSADHAAWPKPAEIAETIGFLASPGNTLTSGALVPVYGRA
jgi:NAD(P)-dependent dehydrogenase (short-subunit alcohol dehydrogenase family)